MAGLPGETALALIIGGFVNIYAAIAVLIPLIPSLPLDIKQPTVSHLCAASATAFP
ncbi:hypothetical protein [Syntrophaceticus schinkii]|uniref:Nucleoside recognition domain protein (Part 1) n=1 Tax=Syntrophaceticus schinkii TaxID=499207 RepID=A0A0B7MR32_9FIRM|nr:hypothetical protein [Syntrophaceticus schinkii]MDD4262049.1 hypothetical protein [Syntrophaceticus schinkii]CEO90476.1 Nucleoside recognition domain protein (Part 1) [Syntrophaceticus schinkii]